MRFLLTSIRCLAAALAVGAPLALSSAEPALPEGQVKSALVLNFARYVEWPESAFATAADPFLICLLGRDTLGGALSALEGKKIRARTVDVKSFLNADEVLGCHVVYIAETEERRLVPVLKRLSGKAILTLSDMSGFVEAGGAIGIVQGENRLQFEVNRKTLELSKLKASSNLLKLARNLTDSTTKPSDATR